MPSSELQSRMTSLPISWDPWIWQCGAEGGTTIGRVRNKVRIYYKPTDDGGDINIQCTEQQITMLIGHVPEDSLLSVARG